MKSMLASNGKDKRLSPENSEKNKGVSKNHRVKTEEFAIKTGISAMLRY